MDSSVEEYDYSLEFEALSCACVEEDINAAKLIIKRVGKNAVLSKDNESNTLLMVACLRESVEFVRLFLENGAVETINDVNNEGKTTLWYAYWTKNDEIVNLLLKNGAGPYVGYAIGDPRMGIPLDEDYSHITNGLKFFTKKESIGKMQYFYEVKDKLFEKCFDGDVRYVYQIVKEFGKHIINCHNKYGFTPLMSACLGKQKKIVEILLDIKGVWNIHQKNLGGKTAMSFAMDNKCYEIVKLLEDYKRKRKCMMNFFDNSEVFHGKKIKTERSEEEPVISIQIDIQDLKELTWYTDKLGSKFCETLNNDKNAVFHKLCKLDELDTIKDIKDYKSWIKLGNRNKENQTILDIVCRNGSDKCLTYLMSINTPEDFKSHLTIQNCLDVIKYSHWGTVEKFINYTSSFIGDIVTTNYNQNILMALVADYDMSYDEKIKNRKNEIFKYLVEKVKVTLKHKDHKSRYIMEYICVYRYIEGLEVLSNTKESLFWSENYEVTCGVMRHMFPKMDDLDYEGKKFIKRFVELSKKRSDIFPSINDKPVASIYHIVVSCGRIEYIPFLHKNFKEDVKCVDENGDTALLFALQTESKKLGLEILNYNVFDINVKNKDGETPLIIASKKGYNKVVLKMLCCELKNVNQQTDYARYSALMHACLKCSDEVVYCLLKQRGINVNLKNKYGDTALSFCVKNELDVKVGYLLARSEIELSSKNIFGKTPLIYAYENERPLLINSLLNHENMNFIKEYDSAVKGDYLYVMDQMGKYFEKNIFKLKRSYENAFLVFMNENKRICIKASELISDEEKMNLLFRNLYNKFSKDEYSLDDMMKYAKENKGNECCICTETYTNIVFKPCGHTCCSSCVVNMLNFNENFTCHICRAEIKLFLDVDL